MNKSGSDTNSPLLYKVVWKLIRWLDLCGRVCAAIFAFTHMSVILLPEMFIQRFTRTALNLVMTLSFSARSCWKHILLSIYEADLASKSPIAVVAAASGLWWMYHIAIQISGVLPSYGWDDTEELNRTKKLKRFLKYHATWGAREFLAIITFSLGMAFSSQFLTLGGTSTALIAFGFCDSVEISSAVTKTVFNANILAFVLVNETCASLLKHWKNDRIVYFLALTMLLINATVVPFYISTMCREDKEIEPDEEPVHDSANSELFP